MRFDGLGWVNIQEDKYFFTRQIIHQYLSESKNVPTGNFIFCCLVHRKWPDILDDESHMSCEEIGMVTWGKEGPMVKSCLILAWLWWTVLGWCRKRWRPHLASIAGLYSMSEIPALFVDQKIIDPLPKCHFIYLYIFTCIFLVLCGCWPDANSI